MELILVEAFVGAGIVLNHLNTKIAAGEPIDAEMVGMHSQATNALVKVGAKLGTERRAKLVPSLDEFLELRRRARGEAPKAEVVE